MSTETSNVTRSYLDFEGLGRLRGQAPIKPIPFEKALSAKSEGPA